jgi:importin subunit beta-1
MDMLDQQYTQLFTNALSSDKQIREAAEKTLSDLASADPTKFLLNLSFELADEAKQTPGRQMAAAVMKNFITISDKTKDIWINLDIKAKDQIKNSILSTLASKEKNVRKAAGMVIAGICKVDLPLAEKWPNLVFNLCSNSYNDDLNIRHAAIESLGYLCEELTIKTIDALSIDSILSALIRNITDKEINPEILFTALNAFLHCLPLAEKNFSKQNENVIIMNALFDVCSINMNNDSILEKISQIFIDVCVIYYDYIADYIAKFAEFTFWIVIYFPIN